MANTPTSKNDIDELLIDPADFRSVNLRISFENQTTRTAVKDGSRIYGEKKSKNQEDLSIRLLEFLPNGLVLEVPAHSCSTGHRLTLSVVAENLPASTKVNGGKLEFKPTVTVSESEKIDRMRDRIAIEFVDFDEWAWKTFTDLYAERQRQIIEFFEAVKP